MYFVWRASFTGTKFGNERGKVQHPARFTPQTHSAGGTDAETRSRNISAEKYL